MGLFETITNIEYGRQTDMLEVRQYLIKLASYEDEKYITAE